MTKMVYPSQRADQILPLACEYMTQDKLAVIRKIKSLRKSLVKTKSDISLLARAISDVRSAKLYTRDSNEWLQDWDDGYTSIDDDHKRFMVVGMVSHLAVLGKSAKNLQRQIDSSNEQFYAGLYAFLRAKEFPSTITTRKAVRILLSQPDLWFR